MLDTVDSRTNLLTVVKLDVVTPNETHVPIGKQAIFNLSQFHATSFAFIRLNSTTTNNMNSFDR
jgi:hypothetical protein